MLSGFSFGLCFIEFQFAAQWHKKWFLKYHNPVLVTNSHCMSSLQMFEGSKLYKRCLCIEDGLLLAKVPTDILGSTVMDASSILQYQVICVSSGNKFEKTQEISESSWNFHLYNMMMSVPRSIYELFYYSDVVQISIQTICK